jgi:hypothetical protein
MAIACQKRFITGRAVLSFARDAHALVERSIFADLPLSVVLLSVEVEQSSVSDLNLCLIDYILV